MQSIYIDVFSGFSYDELFPLIAEIGFEGFFSSECYADNFEKLSMIKQNAEKFSLIQETSHSTIPGSSLIWNNHSAGDKFIDVLKLNIDNCSKLSIPILVVHIQPDFSQSPSFDIGLKRLKTVVKYAKEQNVKIAFENINSADYLYRTFAYFDDNNVGFCYDCGHEACYTQGERYLSRIGERLFCTHIHDNDSISDLHMIPFDSQINFAQIAQELKACNYKGNLTLELTYTPYIDKLSKTDFLKKSFMAADKIKKLMIT